MGGGRPPPLPADRDLKHPAAGQSGPNRSRTARKPARAAVRARSMSDSVWAADHGVIFHPRHNWFLSAAHTESDIERALTAARAGLRAVRERFGPD